MDTEKIRNVKKKRGRICTGNCPLYSGNENDKHIDVNEKKNLGKENYKQ